IGCKKESIKGDPVEEYHILNFVDNSGVNLFESNQISPSEFKYGSGTILESWEDLQKGKEHHISYFKKYKAAEDNVLEILEENEYLIIEEFQGEEVKGISINGVQYTLKLAPLKDGVFLNDKALEFSTDSLDKNRTFYLHHIVLE
ncbi:MAG: hypothetical protein M3512_07940, partial [Bacteroidota bacterium]|nr:hypothetical protein [Bacteroidota bacterium]